MHFKAKLKIFCIRLFVLWLPFSVGCLIAIPVSLIAVVSGSGYAKNMLIAMDRLAAAVMCWDGKNTVSAECGLVLHTAKSVAEWMTVHCVFCWLLCNFIHRMDGGHCNRNAIEDGLVVPATDVTNRAKQEEGFAQPQR